MMAWSDRRYADSGSPLFASSQWSATLWIIAITVAVQVVIWLVGGGMRGSGTYTAMSWLDLQWNELLGPQIWRWVTYVFLHGSVGHLFWNMLLLYFMGRMLEPHMGRKRFTIVYLTFGALAGLGYPIRGAFLDGPHPGVIGASGAIMGLVGLFGARFPRAQVLLLFVPVTGAAMAAIIVGIDVLSLIATPEGSGTAVGVHLAGASVGVIWGLWSTRLELVVTQMAQQRRRRSKQKEQARLQADNAEMDRILEKISSQGMGELTDAERDFLRRQSERLKGRS